MTEAYPVSTPLDIGTKLKKPTEEATEQDKKLPYRELVGALTYLAMATKPDICHAVSFLGQFNNCFRKTHWNAAKRVLRYLKGTMDLGIMYRPSRQQVSGFVDADWGNCIDDRRSCTGYAFILSSGPVSWDSKKQRTIALSSTEAEYMAMTEAAKEGIYLKNFLEEIYHGKPDIKMYSDSLSALRLAQNPVYHAKSKHIDIKHHFIQEVLQNKILSITHIRTEKMAADMLTKGLPKNKHCSCIRMLGMVPGH